MSAGEQLLFENEQWCFAHPPIFLLPFVA